MFSHKALAAVAAMLTVADAHMLLANPVPFSNGKGNGPIDASAGTTFPCKGGPYTVTSQNKWAVGSTQTLSFSGSAVHGGGSCQISVTTDKVPSEASKWKVIYSIEGGCPASVPGNLPDGSHSTPDFPFTVPSELPNGDLTMAWTWFNHVGNREMYMNCAPVTVTGGASDASKMASLPDMAMANIPQAGSCKTSEGFDYTFKNPGQYSIRVGKGPFKELCGGAASDAPTGNGPAAASPPVGSAAPPAGSAAPPAGTVSAGTAKPPATLATITKSAYQPAASGQSTPVPSLVNKQPTVPASAPAAAPTGGYATPAQPSGGASPAAKPPSSVPVGAQVCSTEGAIVCNGAKQFGLCNFGQVVYMAVAEGTECQNGAIVKKRSVFKRHAHAHAHAHAHRRRSFF